MKEGIGMFLYRNMLKQYEGIKQKITRIEQQIERLPQGSLKWDK